MKVLDMVRGRLPNWHRWSWEKCFLDICQWLRCRQSLEGQIRRGQVRGGGSRGLFWGSGRRREEREVDIEGELWKGGIGEGKEVFCRIPLGI